MANILPAEKRLRVLAALVDGNSERATERMTGVQQKTISRFALMLGAGAEHLHNRLVRDLSCSVIQVDEIFSYVKKKQARVDPAKDGDEVGEAYTFVAMDANSRLVISYLVGKRNQQSTDAFMEDLRARLVVMPAITSDGFSPYISAIGAKFGPGVDFAQMRKHFKGRRQLDDDHRYEPPRAPFITKNTIFGAPDLDRASTSYIERNNGTMRHHIGRMRRLCYAFSKRLKYHKAAVALCYAHYNFCHVVKTLRVTPAMAAGITDHVWDLEEFMAALLSAPPCETPSRKPLMHRTPEAPARELPNGRGFLRLVSGGGGAPPATASRSPPPAPPPPPMKQTPHPRPVGDGSAPTAPAEPSGQLDASSSKPSPRAPMQLSLFDDPPSVKE